MKHLPYSMTALFGACLLLAFTPGHSLSQSNPGLVNGQVPTAGQWNSYFAAKQDFSPGAVTGPGAATAGHLVTWGTTYPGVVDGGAPPSAGAGYCTTVTGGPAYIVNLTRSCQALRGYIDGLNLSTAGSSQVFAISAGAASDSTAAAYMPLGSSINKTLASNFTAGTNNGCLDTGAAANTTWYHIFLIEKSDFSASDILCSTSLTPSMPATWGFFRYIGSMLTNGSAQWIQFTQWGDEFRWNAPVNDVNSSTLGTGATNFTLTVPPGVTLLAKVRGYITHASAGTKVIVSSPLVATPVAGTPAGEVTAVAQVSAVQAPYTVDILTDTSQHVTAVSSAASTTIVMDTYGWVDRRGRNN